MNSAASIETFKTNFNVNTDLADVEFRQISVAPYSSQQRNQFGEKICVLYLIEVTVFNVDVRFRVLAFKYENHAEVLKLEISVGNELLGKEIAPCKNFLQRKRNMNLTFEVLIKFAKLFEMRRLIDQTVFQKQRNIMTLTDDNGMNVKCCNSDSSIMYLELNWTISWNVDQYEVSDLIEFYFNYSVVERPCAAIIKEKLNVLVHLNSDFHSKLKLWKSLMQDLYGSSISASNIKKTVPTAVSVLEISDSDSDESDVIEVDFSCGTNNDEILIIE